MQIADSTREALSLGLALGAVAVGTWGVYLWWARRRERDGAAMLGMFFGGVRQGAGVNANPELVEKAKVIVASQPDPHTRISTLEAAGHLLSDGHWMWSDAFTKAVPAPTAPAALERARVVTELCALLGGESKEGRSAVLTSVAEDRLRLDGLA